MKEKPLIIITGPTASGKSGLAIKLAQKFDGEIVSCDSMQVYKKMDIGTAKALPEEQMGIKHHLIDILEPEEEFSIADYVEMARKTIDDIHSRGKIPFLVGGTTLYIQAIADNIQFFDLPSDTKLREELAEFATEKGNEKLWQILKEIDSELADKLHFNNTGRIIRAIEVYKLSGKTQSYWQKESVSVKSPYFTIMLGLCYKNREQLYEIINQRVDEMLKKGLVDEINKLHLLECSKTAKQAIGYKELWPYIKGEDSLDNCVEILKQETRRYAKRQMTWMRSRPDLRWFFHEDYDSKDDLVKVVEDNINRLLEIKEV